MSEIHADGGPLPFIPDDLTIAQFILNEQHPMRPIQTGTRAWLIEEATGRQIGSDEVGFDCHIKLLLTAVTDTCTRLWTGKCPQNSYSPAVSGVQDSNPNLTHS